MCCCQSWVLDWWPPLPNLYDKFRGLIWQLWLGCVSGGPSRVVSSGGHLASCSERGLPSTSARSKWGTAGDNPSVRADAEHTANIMIHKGDNENTFFISEKGEKDILSELRLKAWGGALGGIGNRAFDSLATETVQMGKLACWTWLSPS